GIRDDLVTGVQTCALPIFTDALEAAAIPTVGPSREAAHLETNKEFTRTLMREHKIPGFPQFWAFDNLSAFGEFVNDSDFEFVIKDRKSTRLNSSHQIISYA